MKTADFGLQGEDFGAEGSGHLHQLFYAAVLNVFQPLGQASFDLLVGLQEELEAGVVAALETVLDVFPLGDFELMNVRAVTDVPRGEGGDGDVEFGGNSGQGPGLGAEFDKTVFGFSVVHMSLSFSVVKFLVST